jgi:ribonuclease BN (tRNA processing enzyme)
MTKLIFLGTKGEIEEHSKSHKYHSSLLIKHGKFKLLIDYGELHKYSLDSIKPDAVLITHAHPDHYIWIKKNVETNITIYLTKETLDYGKFKPISYKLIKPGKKFTINHFKILPYRVLHSIKCPTIGFKIQIDKKVLIYNPDLVDIENKNKILKNIDYYIGDGSCINANLVRKKGSEFFGHTRITTQVNWCKKFGIKENNIIFTHLGKETIRQEKQFKRQHKEIIFAYDEMEIKI